MTPEEDLNTLTPIEERRWNLALESLRRATVEEIPDEEDLNTLTPIEERRRNLGLEPL